MPPDPAHHPDRGTLVCVGEIVAPHGVRGLVRVRSFTEDPAALTEYGPLTDAAGERRFGLTLLSPHRGQWLARIDGVTDRDRALALRGTRLHVDRSRLPPTQDENEFYHADLIGLAAVRPDGTAFGSVRAVHDFGAGDVLEIVPPPGSGGGSVMLPFTRAAVPEIDLAAGRLVVDPPDGLLAGTPAASAPAAHGGGDDDEEGGEETPERRRAAG